MRIFTHEERLFVFAILGLLFGSLLTVPGTALDETVSLPLQLDYPFLGNLVVQTAFTGPGRALEFNNRFNQTARSDGGLIEVPRRGWLT